MIGKEVSAAEWNKRLGISNGEDVSNALRRFHERAIIPHEPIWDIDVPVSPHLPMLGIACVGIESLSLGVALSEHSHYQRFAVCKSFAESIGRWSDFRGRIERESRLHARICTVATMLNARLLRTAWAQCKSLWPEGARMPRSIEAKAYESFAGTLIHVVVFLAIGEQAMAEMLKPWIDLMLAGNFPIGLTNRDTFVILTR